MGAPSPNLGLGAPEEKHRKRGKAAEGAAYETERSQSNGFPLDGHPPLVEAASKHRRARWPPLLRPSRQKGGLRAPSSSAFPS
uniref:Uncharacterized protein n=1 Tax=Haematococcus lacustris TaxID=44745 RepID=A0A2K9YRL2_HAELA|nr:hypothetical protein SG3EUKT975000.1 [Haematococcus lacustris]AUW36453.1 hypothetical protein SG3EUKT975000.1 [Haematococcus lacustris]